MILTSPLIVQYQNEKGQQANQRFFLDEEFHGGAVLVGSIRILLLTEFLLLQEFWVFGSLVTLVMATRPLGSRLNW